MAFPPRRSFLRSFVANVQLLWPQLLLAAFSGGMFALSFCGYDQDYLAWFCFVPALFALSSANVRTTGRAALVGWAMGFAAHLGVYHWLVGMLRDFGYLPLPLALLGYALVCLVQSSLFAGIGALTWHAWRRWQLDPMWGTPLALCVFEWGTPSLFPSFLANSQYRRIVLLQGCEFYGVTGLSFVVALASGVTFAVLAWATSKRPKFPLLGAVSITATLVGLLWYGHHAVAHIDAAAAASTKRLRVGVVQANMGIYEKTEFPIEGLRRHREQSLALESDGAELIVWPESAYYFALDPNVHNVKQKVLGQLHTPLLFGGMRIAAGNTGQELFNSAFLTDAAGELQASYDKTHLLAFGEYLPFGQSMPWLYQFSPQTSLFTPGRHTTPMQFGNLTIGTLICYEDILPNFVRKAMQASPDILINLTNDAWFGHSHEPRIHLALATFRAIEQRRFLIRATNTGISAIIDPAGRILQETPIFARANVLADVVGLTGVTAYQRCGDWPAWAALLAFAATWLRALVRRGRQL